MDLLGQIRKNLDPARYNMPDELWNSLILNSRIRFHSFFRHFQDLSTEESLALSEYRLTAQHFKSYISTFIKYTFLKSFFGKRKKKLVQALANTELIMLKNFSYKSSIVGNKFKDPFFHSLTDRLVQESNHLIIVDPLMSTAETKLLENIEGLNIIPWYVFLCFSDYVKAVKIQFSYFLSFNKHKSESWDKELKQELLHPTTFHHLLFYYAFKRITSTFKVKRLVTTYENNSWEKVVMQAFRENSPQTIIVGYQHSVVPESTLGMRLLPWEISRRNYPDMVFTTGFETQNILRSFNPTLDVPIKALCALRYEYLYSMEVKREVLNRSILVALEAIHEAADLINLVLELKDFLVNNNFKITFRFHPAMTYDYFKTVIDSNKLESFATISHAPLSDDLKNNDCIIYWGSTVALESSFIGNALINFQSSFPLSHDPLYLCGHFKYAAKNSEEMRNSLEKLYSMNLEKINQERAMARNYLENYFLRPSPENLNTLLGIQI